MPVANYSPDKVSNTRGKVPDNLITYAPQYSIDTSYGGVVDNWIGMSSGSQDAPKVSIDFSQSKGKSGSWEHCGVTNVSADVAANYMIFFTARFKEKNQWREEHVSAQEASESVEGTVTASGIAAFGIHAGPWYVKLRPIPSATNTDFPIGTSKTSKASTRASPETPT